MSNKWKSVIAAVAPTLATVLGGPLMGTGVDILCRNVLDRDPSGNEKNDLKAIAAKVITGAPAVIEQLKKSENDLLAMDLDFAKIDAADRANAREHVDKESWMPGFITVTMVLGFFLLGALMVSGQVELDGSVGNIAGMLLGYVANDVKQIISFHFGSSSGSNKKNTIIERLMGR